MLKSIANIPHDRFVQGTLLNMKIEPAMLSDENGITQIMALLKSLCSLGIYHVQFNVVDKEKLIDAQQNPEQPNGGPMEYEFPTWNSEKMCRMK